MSREYKPDGYTSVSPYLVVAGAGRVIDFLKQAFDATELRRYDMPALVSLLERAGFAVERKSHLGFFLYPGFYAAKRRNQSRHAASNPADEQRVVEQRIAATRRSGGAMGWVMKAEEALRSRFYYPVGVRCLVTVRKPA